MPQAVTTPAPLLAVRQLQVAYPLAPLWPWQPTQRLRAVDGVNFNLEAGETLGIVGESGCGKSTLARALVGLQPVTSGAIHFGERDLARLDERGWRGLRREIQMVFQDPLSSLDPRMTVGESIAEPLQALCPELSAAQREMRVDALMERTGLGSALRQRYPHELSGGQCQRVGIARALAPGPRMLVCDEPVSALDVSVQAQIINLLMELQREQGLAMIFIAHDLEVVRHVSGRVLVMYLGRVMEQAERDALFASPGHPYTRLLLASAPSHSAAPPAVDGEIPSLLHPPAGCAFASRCNMADEHCTRVRPHYRQLASGSTVACHYVQ